MCIVVRVLVRYAKCLKRLDYCFLCAESICAYEKRDVVWVESKFSTHQGSDPSRVLAIASSDGTGAGRVLHDLYGCI
jgi:hypothetical protein